MHYLTCQAFLSHDREDILQPAEHVVLRAFPVFIIMSTDNDQGSQC